MLFFYVTNGHCCGHVAKFGCTCVNTAKLLLHPLLVRYIIIRTYWEMLVFVRPPGVKKASYSLVQIPRGMGSVWCHTSYIGATSGEALGILYTCTYLKSTRSQLICLIILIVRCL